MSVKKKIRFKIQNKAVYFVMVFIVLLAIVPENSHPNNTAYN